MSLKFILWQSIFIKGTLLLSCFPYPSAMHQSSHYFFSCLWKSSPSRMESPWTQTCYCPSCSLLMISIQNTCQHRVRCSVNVLNEWVNEWTSGPATLLFWAAAFFLLRALCVRTSRLHVHDRRACCSLSSVITLFIFRQDSASNDISSVPFPTVSHLEQTSTWEETAPVPCIAGCPKPRMAQRMWLEGSMTVCSINEHPPSLKAMHGLWHIFYKQMPLPWPGFKVMINLCYSYTGWRY